MSSTINTADLQAYLNHLEAANTLGDTVGFGYTDGKKYYRVYREINSGNKFVISFVDKQYGMIYKAKGWDSASKTSLGNISDYRVEDQVHPDPEIQVHPEVESQEQAISEPESVDMTFVETEAAEEKEAKVEVQEPEVAVEVSTPTDAGDELNRMLADGLSALVDERNTRPAKKSNEEQVTEVVESTESVEPTICYKQQLITYLESRASEGDEQAKVLLVGIDKLTEPVQAKSITRSRVAIANPEEKLEQVSELAKSVAEKGVKATAVQMGKSTVWVHRTNRAYTEIYQQSEIIRNLFKDGKLSWSAIHKMAEKDPAKAGIENLEAQALRTAS